MMMASTITGQQQEHIEHISIKVGFLIRKFFPHVEIISVLEDCTELVVVSQIWELCIQLGPARMDPSGNKLQGISLKT